MTNPHMPELVKIGVTGRTPSARAREFGLAIGMPGQFRVEASWSIEKAAVCERQIHRAFADDRVSGEYFRLAAAAAVERIGLLLRLNGTFGNHELSASERWQVARQQAEQAEATAAAIAEQKLRGPRNGRPTVRPDGVPMTDAERQARYRAHKGKWVNRRRRMLRRLAKQGFSLCHPAA
jgi:hypothetical protein